MILGCPGYIYIYSFLLMFIDKKQHNPILYSYLCEVPSVSTFCISACIINLIHDIFDILRYLLTKFILF